MKNNTIVITGAAGFIGSAILLDFLKNGFQVIASDKKYIESFQDWGLQDTVSKACKSKQLKYLRGDIRDKAFCNTLFNSGDVLIHQAALTSVAESYREASLYNEVNVVGYQNIVGAAMSAGVRKVVYASSSAVDTKTIDPEFERPNKIISPYGKTKASNERFSQKIALETGASFTGLRYYNVVGNDVHWIRNSEAVIAKWIKEAISRGTITVFGNGNQIRDFCSIKHVVIANVRSTLFPKFGSARVIGVGSGSGVSINDLSQVLKEIFVAKFNNTKDIEILTDQLVDPGSLMSVANSVDCSSTLGFQVLGNLNEMLSTLFENIEEILDSEGAFKTR